MHAGRLLGLLGLSGAALLVSSNAAAQSQPAPHDVIDDNARYAWLDAELTEIEGPTERWYTGWTSAFAWVALGQYSFAATAPNTGLREVSIVGAINSTLGLGAMLIAPNTLDGSLERLHAFDASSPRRATSASVGNVAPAPSCRTTSPFGWIRYQRMKKAPKAG